MWRGKKNGDFSDLTTFLTFYCSGTLPELFPATVPRDPP
eukprot:gene8692-6910_t